MSGAIYCRRVRPGRVLLWPDESLRGLGGEYNVRDDDPFIKGFEHVLEVEKNCDPPSPVTDRQYVKEFEKLPEWSEPPAIKKPKRTPKPKGDKAGDAAGDKAGGKSGGKAAEKPAGKAADDAGKAGAAAGAGGDSNPAGAGDGEIQTPDA